MREITELAEKVNQGRVGVESLQKMLAYERKLAEPQITMRTLGTFSAEYENRQATAEQELDESTQAALRNIPIIEGLLINLGASIETPKSKPAHVSDKTSIQITKDTKNRLTKLGIKGDTYDDIIQRLLDRLKPQSQKPKGE